MQEVFERLIRRNLTQSRKECLIENRSIKITHNTKSKKNEKLNRTYNSYGTISVKHMCNWNPKGKEIEWEKNI